MPSKCLVFQIQACTPVNWTLRSFTVCANGVRHEFRCPGKLVLNVVTKQCDFANNTDCPITEEPVAPVLPCPRQGGPLFPHPANCTLAYRCVDGAPKLYPCRNGLHFDYEEQYCASPLIVKCFGDRE